MLEVYYQFIKMAFFQKLAFKLSNIAGLGTNLFFMFFKIELIRAIFKEKADISGYGLQDIITYVVIAQSLLMVISQNSTNLRISESISSGQIGMDLIKPFNYHLMILAKTLGISMFYLITRTLPILAVALLFNLIHLDLFFNYNILLAIISLFFSIAITSCVYFLVELTGFWIENSKGPRRFVSVVAGFLSGSIIPLAFFPSWAQEINYYLPFYYTLNSTIEIATGRAQDQFILLKQLLWSIVLTLLSRYLFSIAKNKLFINGG